MANGVFHTGYGVIVELSKSDLGQPHRPGLMEEVLTPVGQRERTLLQCLRDRQGGECQCALADKTPWMFIRRQRLGDKVVLVAAHLPVTHVATPAESDKRKAMKERIARAASRHGLDAQTEAKGADGRPVTDVLVTGPGGRRIGWQAQYSPVSATTVRRRSTAAREGGITPLWVTGDERAALIDRAPWARVDDVPWQDIASRLTLLVRGGVRHLQVWKCTDAAERACPETGGACGRFHSGWFPPALCLPQERATALDELVVTSADGEHVPVRTRNRHDARHAAYLWAPAADVEKWHAIVGEQNGTDTDDPDPDEPISFTEQELDSSCRYGEPGQPVPGRRPRRDTAAATGLHTFDEAPASLYRAPRNPVQLRLTPGERGAIARQLHCPPWEIGPCIQCATPIHRYGHNTGMTCPTCRTALNQP